MSEVTLERLHGADRCTPALDEDGRVEMSRLCPQDIRLSSRGLGWRVLNLERRESEPDDFSFPAGVTEHLIGISLAGGRLRVQPDAAPLELAPGTLILLPGRTPVAWRWDTRISFSLMALDPRFLEQVAEEDFGMDAAEVELQASVRTSDPVVATIAATLSRELLDARPGNRAYAESLARILCVHLLRQYNRIAPKDDAQPVSALARPVARAVQYIQTHYAGELTLEDVARAAQMSPFHLARTFKSALGVTPHKFLIQTRVRNARALLATGAGRSLADVAESVGFADQSHLTRHMKRELGVTPGEVRSATNGVQPGKRAARLARMKQLALSATQALLPGPTLRSPEAAG